MIKNKLQYADLVEYCGFENLPEGLENIYQNYQPVSQEFLIDRDFLGKIYVKFNLPKDKKELFTKGVEAVETDEKLFCFTKFLIWDMCSARNRCDIDNYNNLIPKCMKNFSEYYSLILLVACVTPSIKKLEKRGVPHSYYDDIPYSPMKPQFEKFIANGTVEVGDFPWDMNFYTCSIFLLDRFYFIPYKFCDNFTMYRNRKTNKVVALRHKGEEFRRDGQINGINNVFDEAGKFISIWEENDLIIKANQINPMGFVEREPITINKNEWQVALKDGDTLLALHIPSGPGYIPERLKSSMNLALEFYNTYFPEFLIKGFWSESWLYDTRLSLILDNVTSNIIKVQNQLYKYPIDEGDSMLRYEAFGDEKADPTKIELKTSLQKAAAAYMKTGARFNTLSMVVLAEEVDKMGEAPYLTSEDIEHFKKTVDSHLK